MYRHLVTIEVSIESFADQWVQVNGVSFNQSWLKRLNTHAVQCGSTIQQHGVICDHLLKDVPDFLILAFQHFLGRLDRISVTEFFQSSNDKRLIEFKRNFLGQTTLVQFQSRTNNNHASSGIINTLAQQIFTETPLLSLDHIGQGLQRSIRRTQYGSLAAIVIEQSINGLLQHPLLIADDDFGCIQVNQLPQAIVAVDDSTVQIIEVAGCEVPAIQQNQRAQVRWDHWDHIKHHPLGTVVAVANRLNDLQPVDQVFLFLL